MLDYNSDSKEILINALKERYDKGECCIHASYELRGLISSKAVTDCVLDNPLVFPRWIEEYNSAAKDDSSEQYKPNGFR